MPSVNLYPGIISEGVPEEFDDEVKGWVEEIYEACKGWGTDEKGLIQALASKNPTQRVLIDACYKAEHDKELRGVMQSELGSRDLGEAMQFLSLPAPKAECFMLKKALEGVGAREYLVAPIIGGRSNDEIQILKEAFFERYETDLAVRFSEELGGDFERMAYHCLQGMEDEYDPEETHTAEKAEEDADLFYEAGQGQFWGTDERGVFQLICKSPPDHLVAVSSIYETKYDTPLLKAMDGEFSGDVEKAVMHSLGMKIAPYKTVAALIKEACRGFGTDELKLTMTLIRYQSILKEVNEAHIEAYEKSIAERVDDETGGLYKDVLLLVIETALNEE